MIVATEDIKGLKLIELSYDDTQVMLDALLEYRTFSTWFNDDSHPDPQLLFANLFDNPTSTLHAVVGYQAARDRLMARYDCDERTLVASLVSYARTAPQAIVNAGR